MSAADEVQRLGFQLAAVAELRRDIIRSAAQGRLTSDVPARPASVSDRASSDVPWNLPTDWSWRTLQSIAALRIGRTPSTREPRYWGDDHRWVAIGDMAPYGL